MALSYIGSAKNSANNGGSPAINVGGIAGIADGDLLVVISGGYFRGAGDYAPSTNGSGSWLSEWVNKEQSTRRLRVNAKFRSGDTSITIAGSGNASDATVGLILAFRGADPAPLDQTVPAPASNTTGTPNPPSILTQTAHAFVIAIGGAAVNDTSPGSLANYLPNGAVLYQNQTDTDPFTVCAQYRDIASPGTEDPPDFASMTSGIWMAATIAIRELQPNILTANPLAVAALAFDTPAVVQQHVFGATGLTASALTIGTPTAGGTLVVLEDPALDGGLDAFADVDHILVCSSWPTTYAEAMAAELGNKAFAAGAAFTAPQAGADGRSVTSTAITDGDITGSGYPTCWAAVDEANSKLIAVGPMHSGILLAGSGKFLLDSFTINLPRS